MEGEGVKVSRHTVSRRRGNLAILDFHFLLSTKKGVQYFRDLHELALFDRDKMISHDGYSMREMIPEGSPSGFFYIDIESGLMIIAEASVGINLQVR